jgi:hypothetical protein
MMIAEVIMARTFRLKKLINQKAKDSAGCIPLHWKSSGYQEARHRSAEEKHDGYVPRPRHTCLSFPHYTSAYDDVCPSVGFWISTNSPKLRIKPIYTRKKN